MKCTDCHAPVRPVIAFDLDGTMGRYHKQLLDFMRQYFDRDLPSSWDGSGNWEDYLGLPRDQYQEAKLAFRQGGFKRWMPPYAGASFCVSKARTLGFEVWITTTRPYLRLDSVDPDTREWLNRNGVVFDHLLYDERKYPVLARLVGAERVMMVVEDLPEQYNSAAVEFGMNVPILMERDHNASFRGKNPGVRVCRSMTEVSHLIEAAYDVWSGANA